MSDIKTEWEFCERCGAPVVVRDNIKQDVLVFGRHGEEQHEEGVEHECNLR